MKQRGAMFTPQFVNSPADFSLLDPSLSWRLRMQSDKNRDPEKRHPLALQAVAPRRVQLGVLDRLLEEPALDIEAISWYQPGAMNGA